MNSGLQIHPRVIQVIQKQIAELVKRPPDSIQYIVNETDILDIQADIHGPVGTPYAGGVFRTKLVLSSEFPKVPPKGFFLTKIFHPNISEKGEICVNTLKKDWDPTNWSLQHVLEVIRCLLIVPFPESALNEEAGKAFMDDYEEYAQHARLITELYALPKEKGTASSPTEKLTTMEVSFENTREDSPKKVLSPTITSSTLSSDSQLLKLGSMESPFGGAGFKVERPEEVLMTVTNSYNPNPLNTLDEIGLKKATSVPLGNIMGLGGAQAVSTPTSAGIGANLSAKKENDDKKKWKKRI